MNSFETVRPRYGLMGAVFEGGGDPSENLLEALAQGLDQGEGWVTIEPSTMTWLAHRLLVRIDAKSTWFESEVQHYVEMTIDMVDSVAVINSELLKLLNQLNSQSAGWLIWFDSQRNTISCSMRVPVVKEHWWWSFLMWRLIPTAATVAEANADWLAEISSGTVAERQHPTLGKRSRRDSWMDGVCLGPREPVCVMGLTVTSLDLAQMRQVLETHLTVSGVKVSWPLTAAMQDSRGASFAQLREHWHSEFGLGWQFASIESSGREEIRFEDGPSDTELGIAATKNAELMASQSCIPILGGWVAISPFDIVRHWFIPAPALEEVQVLSRSTFGTVAGLMMYWFEEAYARSSDLELTTDANDHNNQFEDALHSLNLKNGFLTHSTLMSPMEEDKQDRSEEGSESEIWLQPRHSIVCSFGVFNPVGPTVSSLELSLEGRKWCLNWVMRHPFGPEIFEIGACDLDDAAESIPQMIEEAIADVDEGVLGTGPDWVDIRLPHFTNEIRRGLGRFARSQSDDWESACRRIVGGQCDPWACLEMRAEELPDLEIDDPVGLWVDLVTDPSVVFGYQAFMRSAWEGARLFAEGDTDGAQATANSVMARVRERLVDDFAFRENQGMVIKHPSL